MAGKPRGDVVEARGPCLRWTRREASFEIADRGVKTGPAVGVVRNADRGVVETEGAAGVVISAARHVVTAIVAAASATHWRAVEAQESLSRLGCGAYR